MAFDLDEDELKATRKMNKADRNEIEVGEYVRVNNDNRNCIGIGKATKLVNESVYVNMNNKYNLPVCFQINNIVKHSKHLIDLIEVGDIVEIRTGLHSSFKYFVENEDNLLLLEEQVKEFWNIETILTKESYMANCYKVGGKDE